MYYPEELIEEVRTRNDIVEVISGYVRLQKKGSNYFGLCPFHNEKSPSFSVSPGKQMYYCFGCGAGGNVIAGTVTLLSAMPVGVVQCTNPTAFSGGCDAESDEALRGRVLASYQRLPNGANAAYYEQEAMRYPGVAAAKAVGRARGIGTVNVVIATHAGVPDAALLAAVETDLQKKREIAVDVKVLAPAVETVSVTAALKAAPGYTFAEVKAGAQSALEALFTGGLLGKSVTTARLLTLLCGVEGVENVHLTAPAADVAVGSTELPMLGTVTISELTEA